MFRPASLLTAILLLASTPALAQNAETANWGEVKGWTIGVDFTVGNGCFIVTDFEDGTTFRLGFDKASGGAYMAVGNAAWASIEDGKEYDIQVQMDRARPWYATATGGKLDDKPVLIATTDEANFVVEVMRKKGIKVTYEGQVIANLSLYGTSAAVAEMVRCQDEMDRNGGPRNAGADPFAKPGAQPASDPFAR